MTSKTATKRHRWFTRGADAVRRYLAEDVECYVCPLCLRAFSTAALGARVLTLEHVPPKALGGKPMVLTCIECNRGSSNADSQARNLEDIIEFAFGDATRVIPVEISIHDLSFHGSLTAEEGGVNVTNAPRANHPDTNTRLDALFAEKQSSFFEGGFKVHFKRPFHYQAALVSWLRAAYLVAFSALGYQYAFRSQLNIVREQIANPRESVIPRFSITVTDAPDWERRILIVEAPEPLSGSVMVFFGRHAIILPGLESKSYFYDRLAASTSADQQLSGDISGKMPDWPTEATYFLD